MSAIVSTYVIAERDLPGLREAADKKPRFLRKPLDRFPEYFRSHARPLSTFGASGFIFNPLLVLLEERKIPVMKSRHDSLAQELQSARGVLLYLFFTTEHREQALKSLQTLSMSEAELEQYYEAFNESHAPGAGEAMNLAVQFLVSAMEAVPSDGVVLFEMA